MNCELSNLTSGGKEIYLKGVLIQTNAVLLEGLDGLITMLHGVCAPWVMPYRYPLVGFSSPAQPGAVTVSEVHPESLSLATEVQAEILQLPPLVVQGVLQGVNTLQGY